jgi:hypothetical protein
MLGLVRNRIVRLSLMLLMRVGAVCAVVLWQTPQDASACNGYAPVNVQTGCGTACGCYYVGGHINCYGGYECGDSCIFSQEC